MKRFELADGWVVQAFDFALDPTPDQTGVLARHFGGRRYAYNWAVRTLKDDIEAFRAGRCEVHHHRDDNAAVNLARYPASGWRAVGPVGSPVKRRAARKTGPRPAGGVEAPEPNPERGAA